MIFVTHLKKYASALHLLLVFIIDHLYIYLIFLIIAEVVSEEAIFKWYKDAHSSKGKMHFLEQMKKFIEWLQNAEEGDYFSVVLVLASTRAN